MPTPETVVVHPLVLLSVVDHYNRVARDTRKRVVGVLLGEASRGTVQVTNAFGGACARACAVVLPASARGARLLTAALCAVPFEEDERDPKIWFLDHSYVESMAGMYRRVAGKPGCAAAAPAAVRRRDARAAAAQPRRRLWAGTARAPGCARPT